MPELMKTLVSCFNNVTYPRMSFVHRRMNPVKRGVSFGPVWFLMQLRSMLGTFNLKLTDGPLISGEQQVKGKSFYFVTFGMFFHSVRCLIHAFDPWHFQRFGT